jgi:peptidoglycan-N-acetylmuramic acid deacetylase
MVSGRLTMRPANKLAFRFLSALLLVTASAFSTGATAVSVCNKPIYLTFDTGHMDIAPLVADVLNRHNVKVTFFAANERSKVGDGSLGEHWAAWWKARGLEGHEFASHTYDHVYWRSDLPGLAPKFRVKPSAGESEGQEFSYDTPKYCEQLTRANHRLETLTGQKALPLFRAPGGKTSPQLLEAAKSCGFLHVGWAEAGFLGDELPSEKFSNAALLKKALNGIKKGDILMAHLGIWSRKDPWAPTVLEPLIIGLKNKGFCFATLRDHPAFSAWVAASGK